MPDRTFFLDIEESSQLVNPFERLMGYLQPMQRVSVQRTDDNHAIVAIHERAYQNTIEYLVPPNQSIGPTTNKQRIVWQSNPLDFTSEALLRAAAADLGWRVFSVELGCYLPSNPQLEDVSHIAIEPVMQAALQQRSMRMLYINGSTKSYYAQAADNSIHILNPAIISYVFRFGVGQLDTPEFSYGVAPDLPTFTALFDQWLIPLNFYQYYRHSLKILNDSYFDIHHIDRKVFIKPLVHELPDIDKGFHLLGGEGSSLVFMDKVRKGETLHQTIIRILKEELKLGEDYIAARVLPDLEFDRDRDGVLTPRLVVAIYINAISDQDRNRIAPLTQRSWRSA